MNWPLVPLLDAISDVSSGNTKIAQRDYLAHGQLPIIDQGSDFIGGYTDDESARHSAPGSVIIFGDHTKIFKFVNFPFAMGADGVKVLAIKDGWDARFVFHFLRSITLPDVGYSRHFKFLKTETIPSVPLSEQRRIAAILDRAFQANIQISRSRNRLRELENAVVIRHLARSGYTRVKFSDVVKELRNGISPSAKGSYEGRVFTLSSITRGSFDPTAHKTAVFDRRPGPNQIAAAGDFLICRGNGNVHLVGRGETVPELQFDIVFPDTVIGATLDGDRVQPGYISAVWNLVSVRRQIEAAARTTSGIHKINQSSLSEIEIPLLPPDEQQLMINKLHAIDNHKSRIFQFDQVTTELATALQSRAFRGEL